MTVQELIDKLQTYPNHYLVVKWNDDDSFRKIESREIVMDKICLNISKKDLNHSIFPYLSDYINLEKVENMDMPLSHIVDAIII